MQKTGAHAPLRHADEHRSRLRRRNGNFSTFDGCAVTPATSLGLQTENKCSAKKARRMGEAQLAEARRVAFARHELKPSPWVDEAPSR